MGAVGDGDVGRPDGELAAEGHGLLSVDGHVVYHLAYLVFVQVAQPQVFLKITVDAHIAAAQGDLGGLSFHKLTAELVGSAGGDLKTDLACALRVAPTSKVVADLAWLGLFSADPLPEKADTLLDVLAERMLEKMQYAPGERDMIVMQHEFTVKYPVRMEKLTSTLLDYGIPHGESAMSRLVALPAAIAVRLILEGKIDLTGVRIPVWQEIYDPVLAELSEMGVTFKEKTEVIEP